MMKMIGLLACGVVIMALKSYSAVAHAKRSSLPHFVHIQATDKYQRSAIADLGVSIEGVRSDSIYGLASDSVLEAVKKSDFRMIETFKIKSKPSVLDFPDADARYHNYARLTK